MLHLFFMVIFVLIANLTQPSYQVPIRPINQACRRLPYDFWQIPGTRDFFFLRYEFLDFSGAREFCISQGMDLPSIKNLQQNSLIHSFIQHSKYQKYHTIGISPLSNINNNIWLNGDEFIFKNFAQNISTNVLDVHIQIRAEDGQWELAPCNRLAGVVCQIRC